MYTGVLVSDPTERLVTVATLYHVQKMTQQQIAHRMGLSRQTIARLLARAEEEDVVRIEIRGPRVEAMRLEAELMNRYSLQDVFVVESSPDSPRRNEEIGGGCWRLIARNLKPGDSLALGWRRTLGLRPEHVDATAGSKYPGVTVVQADGGVAGQDEPNPTFAIASLAAVLNAQCYIVQAPLYTSTPETAAELRRDSVVSLALDHAARSQIVVFGIGALNSGDILFTSGQVNEQDRLRLRELGAVGDILGQFFDLEGRIVDPELSRRTIALQHEDLRRVPLRIGVCPGRDRVESVKVAVRTGLTNALVLDPECANLMLA